MRQPPPPTTGLGSQIFDLEYLGLGQHVTLRDTSKREGKCGICEYQKICGGSRSRAYALFGDYLAEDPRCTYQPHLADALAG